MSTVYAAPNDVRHRWLLDASRAQWAHRLDIYNGEKRRDKAVEPLCKNRAFFFQFIFPLSAIPGTPFPRTDFLRPIKVLM